MKKRIFIPVIILLIVILSIIGISYGYLRTTETSENNQTLTLSNFNVRLLNDMTSVTLNTSYPMTDMEGLTLTPTTFQIKNTGAIKANYRVSLIDSENAGIAQNKQVMNNNNVRYRLTKTVGSGEPQILPIDNLDASGIIDSGTIEANVTISYELVCWIDIDANPNNQIFSKVVLVEGMQVESLDVSGANFPELLDNMIPVYYVETSETEGVWKKADSTNKDTDYKWFDYDDQMWANAVTVKENGTHDRDYYLDAINGTTIEMNDITTMWVWIPRYKYEIFNDIMLIT